MSHTAVGIDLGTSNSVVAVAGDGIEVVPCTQVTSPGTIGEVSALPSALYLPAVGEFAEGSFRLPWSEADSPLVGVFARDNGAIVPHRVVTSAKSWLSNSRCDRTAPILPWGGDASVSPVTASKLYLEHLLANLRFHRPQFSSVGSGTETTVVLTVPASFDEAARSLTHQAARDAGWGEAVLLEEPQAALYAWIEANAATWRETVQPGQVILVCDVGGGTTDFSLILVSERNGELELERLSVGDHILLGGDNMDLALAYRLKAQLEADAPIDHWQFLTLVHQARHAKEQVLKDQSIEEYPIAVASRGASLFASARQTILTRAAVTQTLVEGFFPHCSVDAALQRGMSLGLQELGLPYANDPAISKHLAAFLTASRAALASTEPPSADHAVLRNAAGQAVAVRPSLVLFNGGVFEAEALRERVLTQLRAWGCEDIAELRGSELHTAVARGAAYYAQVRQSGTGMRIRAGTPRSYYLGVQASMPAVPGITPPVFGICVVPQGAEEGTTHELTGKEFALSTGEPAEFRFFSSNTRTSDEVGAVVGNAAAVLDEQSRLSVTLSSDKREQIAVRLRSDVTAIGTLELWMEEPGSDRRWKLEFDLRSTALG